ncbi:high-affnity carbon uptake protein Hat/HatR [Geminocystis sp. NIES-3708]|uniref:WD40 repeat domain-containing protein n=1 Tax=Geminocystis sp. NIES-3708 TaxID=1615909 RepID=UPI0005FCA795|nr:WD40 repeat domain-containing protein [Geminocystis sp. NIES-3708]BAQ59796.1 high-affnity carbon uptake protein Hat/HatR [Geminocystis sp. NIES-3708]
MLIEEETLITAVKGLTRRVNIKVEHLQIIDQALKYNNFNNEQWDNILNRNNINFALKDKIYTMEMVRLLTLRAIVNPHTIIEYLLWLNLGKKSNNNPLNYSLNFQQQVNNIFKNNNSLLVINCHLKKGIDTIIKELEKQNKIIQSLEQFISDNSNLWKDSFKGYLSTKKPSIFNKIISEYIFPKKFTKQNFPEKFVAEKKFVIEKTLSGYSNIVYSVAFSPDSQYLASGSWDNTIKIWNVNNGKLKQTLTGHSNIVYSVAFSCDGQYLASGSWDKTVKIWNVNNGQLKQTLTGYSNIVYSVAFSPDGSYLASGSWDKAIKIWNVNNGKLKQTLTGHSDDVYNVEFSPDGQYLASGSQDKTIKIWNVNNGQLKQTLTGHFKSVNSVAFSCDGQYLASGSGDKNIKIWNVNNGKLKQTLTGHSNNVNSVAFSCDGQYLASGSWDNTIKIWKLQ